MAQYLKVKNALQPHDVKNSSFWWRQNVCLVSVL